MCCICCIVGYKNHYWLNYFRMSVHYSILQIHYVAPNHSAIKCFKISGSGVKFPLGTDLGSASPPPALTLTISGENVRGNFSLHQMSAGLPAERAEGWSHTYCELQWLNNSSVYGVELWCTKAMRKSTLCSFYLPPSPTSFLFNPFNETRGEKNSMQSNKARTKWISSSCCQCVLVCAWWACILRVAVES
jgi:hypothetical protein